MAHTIYCLILIELWNYNFLNQESIADQGNLNNLVWTVEVKSQKWYCRAACAEPKAEVLKPLSVTKPFGSFPGWVPSNKLCWTKSLGFSYLVTQFLLFVHLGNSLWILSPCCHWTSVPIWTKKMQARNSSESTQEEHLTRKIFRIILKTDRSVPIVRCF